MHIRAALPFRGLRFLIPSAAVVFCTALTLAQPAHAAYRNCWAAGPNVRTPSGITWGTRYCHAYMSGPVQILRRRGSGYWLSGTAGDLFAGNSWFVCQRNFPSVPNRTGNARNTWWLYTQADRKRAAGGWGWFPATRISGGSNYQIVPGLRICPANFRF